MSVRNEIIGTILLSSSIFTTALVAGKIETDKVGARNAVALLSACTIPTSDQHTYLYNRIDQVWEEPSCSTDSDCEEKYNQGDEFDMICENWGPGIETVKGVD